MDKPDLSVIVASYNSRRTVRACLNSLRKQDFPGSFEVIVVDSSTDGAGRLVQEEFPEFVLIQCSTRKLPGDARNLGVARAQGDIVCFLDSDCIASPDWLSQIWLAHARPDPVIGGSIGNAALDTLVGWAGYFTEFTRWMPGTPKGRLAEIPSCNLSFKRWILDELGPMDERTYCEDTAYNWRLRQAGYPWPLFEPAIAVAHDGPIDFSRFLTHEVFHGRNYGQMRVALQGFSPLRRLAYTLAVPLIHLVLCWRTLLRILSSKHYIPEFVRASPLAFLGLMAWSVGEGLGYVRGARSDDCLYGHDTATPTG